MSEKKKIGLAHRLYTGDLSYDFVGKRKIWYLVSGIAIALSVLVLLVRGLSIGIEFKGGADFQIPTAVASDTTSKVRTAVSGLNLPDMESFSVLQVGENSLRLQTRSLSSDEIIRVRQAIGEQLQIPTSEITYNLIGASWGDQITRAATIALVVFMVLVMLLIGLYFRNWKMSISAILALFHDLIITVGVYALVGFTVTPATLIGVLTILGYSLYDTVVVFDKVRENVVGLERRNRTYSQAANFAINQVLIRSLNTTLIGVLPVGALLIAGFFFLPNGPLVDLGLALFVGMISGAYSSIFIATPVLAELKEREPEMVSLRARIAKKEAKQLLAREQVGELDLKVSITSDAPSAGRRQPQNMPRSKRKSS